MQQNNIKGLAKRIECIKFIEKKKIPKNDVQILGILDNRTEHTEGGIDVQSIIGQDSQVKIVNLQSTESQSSPLLNTHS